MSKIFLILLIGFKLSANTLEEIDHHLGYPLFEDSFNVGDLFVQYNESCVTSTLCDSFNSKIKIEKVDPEIAEGKFIYSNNYRTFQVSKNDWQSLNGNMLRFLARRYAELGQRISITSIEQVEFVTNQNTKLQALKVVFHIKNNNENILSEEEITLSKHLPGLSQLAKHIQKKTFPIKGSVEKKQILEANRFIEN